VHSHTQTVEEFTDEDQTARRSRGSGAGRRRGRLARGVGTRRHRQPPGRGGGAHARDAAMLRFRDAGGTRVGSAGTIASVSAADMGLGRRDGTLGSGSFCSCWMGRASSDLSISPVTSSPASSSGEQSRAAASVEVASEREREKRDFFLRRWVKTTKRFSVTNGKGGIISPQLHGKQKTRGVWLMI
jgi:hypothetical protein